MLRISLVLHSLDRTIDLLNINVTTRPRGEPLVKQAFGRETPRGGDWTNWREKIVPQEDLDFFLVFSFQEKIQAFTFKHLELIGLNTPSLVILEL